jgi:Asp/Glu/hydantoin racemase
MDKSRTELPRETPPQTSIEDELDALNAVMRLLKPLDKEARARAAAYVVARFGIYLSRD